MFYKCGIKTESSYTVLHISVDYNGIELLTQKNTMIEELRFEMKGGIG